MGYSTTVGLTLGPAQTGLSLRAQLKDTAGVNVGSLVSAGFVELGGGAYAWTGTIPDGFQGPVVFTKADTTFVGQTTINPAELPAAGLLDLADGVEPGWTLRQTFRLLAAVLLGKRGGAGTATMRFRDLNDTTDRVVAHLDQFGNRLVVTRDPS